MFEPISITYNPRQRPTQLNQYKYYEFNIEPNDFKTIRDNEDFTRVIRINMQTSSSTFPFRIQLSPQQLSYIRDIIDEINNEHQQHNH